MAIGIPVILVLFQVMGGPPASTGGAIFFVVLAVGAFAIGMTGNRRRRPAYITLSADGIRAEFRNGRIRVIRWDELDQVRLQQFFFGETHVALRYTSGSWEDRVHIYGDAALKVKEWFDDSWLVRRDPSRAGQNA
jgi:hypothetical protein